MSTVVEVLRRGRELYASAPSHVADPGIPERGTYCPLTANLQAVSTVISLQPFGSDEERANTLYAADGCLRKAAGTMRLVQWNAENSTEVVLEAWDRAIAGAEAKA